MGFKLENITYAYGDHPAIDDLSLSLEPGMFYAVIGPNGCGKTTLIDLLCGHRQPDTGRILLEDRSLTAYGKKELARKIAVMPQEYRINFPYTAREIVCMGRYPHMPRFAAPSLSDMEHVENALASCRARDLAGRYINELSGGEKQRVLFARVLAQNTPVLLLDEPCANLDVKHALHILDLAASRVKRYRAMVVAVMHDINLAARYADALIFMDAGRVAASGFTDDVLDKHVLRKIFDVEACIFYEPAIASSQVVFLK